jgi:hypothetical protein
MPADAKIRSAHCFSRLSRVLFAIEMNSRFRINM